MRTLSISLGILLIVLMAGGAAAQTSTTQTPQWDIKADRDAAGLHCYYYPREETVVREQPLRGVEQQRAQRFQEVEKFQFNQRTRAFEGEPVIREQALREQTLFPPPLYTARVAEKWNWRHYPTPLECQFGPPTPWGMEQEAGRGGLVGTPERPPTYIAGAEQTVTDLSHFENIDGCLYLRPEFPSALQQVNNRQFAPQWHF